MRRVKWLGAVVWIALGAVPAFSQQETGVLRVRVRVPGTLAAISGAQIYLLREGVLYDLPDNEEDLLAYLRNLAIARGLGEPDALSVVMGHSNDRMTMNQLICSPRPAPPGPNSAAGVTDAEGYTTIRDLAPGQYQVYARRTGYAGVAQTIWETIQATGTVSSVVEVNAGETPVETSLLMNPTATVSGRIRDAMGNPAVNACVLLGALNRENGRIVFLPGAHAFTDASGDYRMEFLTPGTYVLRVNFAGSPGGFYFPGTGNLDAAVSLKLEAGHVTTGIDVKLP